MFKDNQKLYIALLGINETHDAYKELDFNSYRRAEFGEVGWVFHPQIFGICNDNAIIFDKPIEESWNTIYALALYGSKEGYESFVGTYRVDPIDAGIGKAVVVEPEAIFIPINFSQQIQATVNSCTVH